MATPTARPPLIVVGASAGGVEALRELVGHLPADFPACVLVVLHVPSTGTSALPAILARVGVVPVRAARDGATLEAGTVLVGVPDHHLVVLSDSVALTRGPHENGHRPSVDVLFRSAARYHGPRVTAVVLSGSLDDGAAGMLAVMRRGGQGVVQDFEEALHDGMPRAAALAGDVTHVLPAAKIPALLSDLVGAVPEKAPPDRSDNRTREVDMSELDPQETHVPDRPGEPAGFGCPTCGGALFQIDEGSLLRFRCRVGHAWSPESLLERQSVALEGALWMALRSLEEKVALNAELGERARERGHEMTAIRFIQSADEAREAAELVRQLVTELGSGDATIQH